MCYSGTRAVTTALAVFKLKLITLDLAGDGLGQAVTEHHNTGVLVRCGILLDILLNFLLQFFCSLDALSQHDGCLNNLATDGIGNCGNTTLHNVG